MSWTRNAVTWLCTACQNIQWNLYDKAHHFDNDETPWLWHHDSLRSFHDALKAHCFICYKAWSQNFDFKPSTRFREFEMDFSELHGQRAALRESDRSFSFYRFRSLTEGTLLEVNLRPPGDSDSGSDLILCILPTSVLGLMHRREQISTASTEDSLVQCKLWLDTCKNHHSICSSISRPEFMPSRLVRVTFEEEDGTLGWQLVESRDLEHLVPYLTLSHCWGSSDHVTLTKATYELFRAGLSGWLLPRTFRDALKIVEALGYHYIWIDSICILQDDDTDWASEAASMSDIYSSSVCNIAATWGKDGDHGCFHQRESDFVIGSIDNNGRSMRLENYYLFYDEVLLAPLNKRGWVVQERCLSSRQLNFTKNQVFWECQETMACETFPDQLPDALNPQSDKLTLYSQRFNDIYTSWENIIVHYSGTKLTRIEDKMIAISGLATEYQRRTGEKYLAGLWSRHLSKGLLWHATAGSGKRSVSYRAPSWSWASQDAMILYDDNGATSVKLFKVKEASVTSVASPETHSFTSGKLVLYCLLGQVDLLFSNDSTVKYARWHTDESFHPGAPFLAHAFLDDIDMLEERELLSTKVSADAEESASSQETLVALTCSCLPLIEARNGICYILLLDQCNSNNRDTYHFERIGLLQCTTPYEHRASKVDESNPFLVFEMVYRRLGLEDGFLNRRQWDRFDIFDSRISDLVSNITIV